MRRRRQTAILIGLGAIFFLVALPLYYQHGALGRVTAVAIFAAFQFCFLKWRFVDPKQERNRKSNKTLPDGSI